MTTKTDERLRADFEAWITSPPYEKPLGINPEASGFPGQYRAYEVQLAFEAYQAGRAALQSQSMPFNDWFDMFMELARAVVVANRLFAVSPTTTKQKVAADAAIALQEHARRHPALQAQEREDAVRLQAMAKEWDRARRGVDSRMPIWESLCDAIGEDADGAGMRAAIDHARRVEGES